MRLARLEYKAHPAPADQLEDLQLRKGRRQPVPTGHLRRAGGQDSGLSPGCGPQQDAPGTEALRRLGRDRSAAFGALI